MEEEVDSLLSNRTKATTIFARGERLSYGSVRETSIHAARTTLTGLLQGLTEAAEGVPNVTDADLAGLGYDLRHAAIHSTEPPAAPHNARLEPTGISGEMIVLLAAVWRAVLSEVESTLDPVNGPWVAVPAVNSPRGVKLTGLTRGKSYDMHVRAVTSGQNRGPWSAIASALAM